MSERFLAGGWRISLLRVLAFAMPAMGLYQSCRGLEADGPTAWLRWTAGAGLMATGAAFAWALTHRRRAVIELGDGWIEFGSIYKAARRRIAWVEVEALEGCGSRLDLVIRTGQVLRLPTQELPAARRRAARVAIERRLART